MSLMNDHDSIRVFSDGLKRAASECKRMAHLKKSQNWLNLSKELTKFRLIGEEAYRQRKRSRQMLLADCDHAVQAMGGEQVLGKAMVH